LTITFFLQIYNFIPQVNGSQLTGNNVNITTKTIIDGGIEYFPIQGDMLRTAHSLPQVFFK